MNQKELKLWNNIVETLSVDDVLELNDYIKQKVLKSKKELLVELIDDWYNKGGETAYFGNHLTKKLKKYNK